MARSRSRYIDAIVAESVGRVGRVRSQAAAGVRVLDEEPRLHAEQFGQFSGLFGTDLSPAVYRLIHMTPLSEDGKQVCLVFPECSSRTWSRSEGVDSSGGRELRRS